MTRHNSKEWLQEQLQNSKQREYETQQRCLKLQAALGIQQTPSGWKHKRTTYTSFNECIEAAVATLRGGSVCVEHGDAFEDGDAEIEHRVFDFNERLKRMQANYRQPLQRGFTFATQQPPVRRIKTGTSVGRACEHPLPDDDFSTSSDSLTNDLNRLLHGELTHDATSAD